ncbi:MAG: thioredoxin domain-containing protein [Anaerolineae bacterium]|nr:thioredoxin domain-containing protein [Anaerolineae bacterium]
MNHSLNSNTPQRAATVAALLVLLALLLAACGSPGLPVDQPAPQAAAGDDGTVAADNPVAVVAESSADRSKGSADAPITIIEYSDFQCPFCSRWVEQTYPSLLKDYVETGQVQLVFRDFPLSFHPNADEAAVASHCAAEQDAYWAMHDALFAGQSSWADLPDAIPTFIGYAGDLGLDTGAFEECLASGKFDAAIQQDITEGQKAGITGTPSFLINDQLLIGAQPYQAFQDAIETVLAGGTLADPNAAAEPEPAAAPEPVAIDIGDAPVKGDPSAPMTIVEYSDYQCPYCERFFTQTYGPLVEDYIASGQAKLVFKDFPLENLHPQAAKAAEAARCVREAAGGSEDAYFEMHDKLFAGQQEWSGSPNAIDIFARYGGELGHDADAIKSCIESGKFTEAVQADLQEGLQIGVGGTPTFFIDGQAFVGAQPIDNFRQAIALVGEGKSIAPPPQPTPVPEPTPVPLTEDISLEDAAGIQGDPNAPVVIVEYTDLQCPFCQRHFQQVMPELQKLIDSGEVLYAVKDFPLTSIHPQALLAANAARCAAEQNQYWPMHDMLFENQQDWSGNAGAADVFKQYAADLGLNAGAFGDCLDNHKYEETINTNLQEGVGYGVRGTPAFFINRELLPGAYPIEAFQQVIAAVKQAQ